MEVDHPLYQAVIDEPESIDARMICADWFDEQGDPRGEFIRLQLQLAEMPSNHPDWLALKGREHELFRRHGARWNAPLHRFLGRGALRNQLRRGSGGIQAWRYYRGFVEAIAVRPRTFADHADLIMRLGPIQHIRPINLTDGAREFAAQSQLARIRTLDLHALFTDPWGRAQRKAVRALIRSEHLSNLCVLDVSNNYLNVDIARDIVKSEFRDKLKELRVFQTVFSVEHARWELQERFGQVVRYAEFEDLQAQVTNLFKLHRGCRVDWGAYLEVQHQALRRRNRVRQMLKQSLRGMRLRM